MKPQVGFAKYRFIFNTGIPQWTPGGNSHMKLIRLTNSALKKVQCKMRWFWHKISSFLKNLLKKLIFHFKLWLPGPIASLFWVGASIPINCKLCMQKYIIWTIAYVLGGARLSVSEYHQWGVQKCSKTIIIKNGTGFRQN